MSQIKGTVEAKSRKGDGIKVNGQWYNAKDFSQFQNVNRGDVADITLGIGNNGKPVVDSILVSPGQAPQKSAYQKKPFVDNSVGMGVGMAVNNAVDLCVAEKGAYDLAYIEAKACDIYELAEKLKANASAGNIRGAQQQAAPQQPSGASDDNPFM